MQKHELTAALAAAITLAVGLASAVAQEEDPPAGIVDLNASPDTNEPLPARTTWERPMPGRQDWSGPGIIKWQRGDLEADRRAVDAMREQTQAIVAQTRAIEAQTVALVELAGAAEAQAMHTKSIADAIQDLELDVNVDGLNVQGEFSLPEDVTNSIIPALDAVRYWLRPEDEAAEQPAEEPAG